MERLALWKPRSTQLEWCPVGPRLDAIVHWWDHSWFCGGEGCWLCKLVPPRWVTYFAALARTARDAPDLFLLERTTGQVQMVVDETGQDWPDLLRRLVVTEKRLPNQRTTLGWRLLEEPCKTSSDVAQLGWSLARLYRMPQFPECTSVGQVKRACEAMSRRQQALRFTHAAEVV